MEDDLVEINSLGFASHTDLLGTKYAYVISVKLQLSLKVIRTSNIMIVATMSLMCGKEPT